MEHTAANGSTLDAAKAKGILKDLHSTKFAKMLHFMVDIMEILGTLSQQFQSDDLFLTDVVSKLELATLKLEQLKCVSGKC